MGASSVAGEWIGEAASAVAGASAAGFWAWWAGRKNGQASFVKAVQDAAHIVIQDLKDERTELRAQIASLRADMKFERDKCEVELGDMRAQIAKLMSGPIPGYTKP